MEINNSTKFRPIVGLEEQIKSLTQFHPGAVYFAKDSGRMFLADNSSELTTLGGAGSSIFYSQTSVTPASTDSTNVLFIFDDLDNGFSREDLRNLKENDLIINSDNCFYRVYEINLASKYLSGIRIAVAGGSGSGSGSGEGSGSTSSLQYRVIGAEGLPNQDSSGTYYVKYIEDYTEEDSCFFYFATGCKNSYGEMPSGNKVIIKQGINILYEGPIVNNGVFTKEEAKKIPFEEWNKFDVRPYLKKQSGVQAFTAEVHFVDDITGSEKISNLDIKFQVIDLTLDWPYDYKTYNYLDQEKLVLDYNLYTTEKQSYITNHILVNGREIYSTQVKGDTHFLTELAYDAYNFSHGVYKIGIYFSIELHGVSVVSETITKNVMIIDRGNTSSLVALGNFVAEVNQYDVLRIPITMYGSGEVILKQNDKEINSIFFEENNSISLGIEKFWNFSSEVAGEFKLSVENNFSGELFQVYVSDIGLSQLERTDYAFKFKASSFPNNDSIKNYLYNGNPIQFQDGEGNDNFDWISGGLIQDEEGRTCFCVKAGYRMIIPYKLFEDRALNGKSVKIVFKATNCVEYDAIVIESKSNNEDTYLQLRAQDAIFHSYSKIDISVPYCEDSYIEYEVDIDRNISSDTGSYGNYIISWIDGVPVNAKVCSDEQQWYQSGAKSNIVVGSDDCDVYLYMIKVYNKHLSKDDHINNFIIDAPSSAEIKSRYNRNQIMDRNEISWKLLMEKNPNLDVHIYDVPRMTTSKADSVKVNSYQLYQRGNSDVPIISAGKNYSAFKDASHDLSCKIKVQGTSSSAYGLSAFNIDTDLKSGMLKGNPEEGNIISGFALEEDGIEEAYFNSKVNVASCEQGNNALNAYWYDLFQPYQSLAKKAFNKRRDTMLFRPGVMFIKDNYKVLNNNDNHVKQNIFAADYGTNNESTNSYLNNPFEKFYSICNFGNSKKNKNTLHGTGFKYKEGQEDEITIAGNSKEICIEITDNEKKGQWMTAVPGYDFDESGKEVLVDLTEESIVLEGIEDIECAVWTDFKKIPTFDANGEQTGEEDYVDENGEKKTVYYITIANVNYEVEKEDDGVHYSYRFQGTKRKGNLTSDGKMPSIITVSVAKYNDIYDKFLRAMQDKEYDIRYANGSDGVGSISPAQVIGFFNLIKWFAQNDVCEYDEVTHPHGYKLTTQFETPVTFEPYTFRSTYPTGGSSKLGGLQIAKYAKSYTHDCHEYRMAKMLSECEDHIIMDSIIYHYLFIETHCMVDNVAKNTFWSSESTVTAEDGIEYNTYWFLNKDYDNDTADGNNNSGKLTLSYGYETNDRLHRSETGSYVFNARPSVWINFVENIQEAQDVLYQVLSKSNKIVPLYEQLGGSEALECNAWDSKGYLKLFEIWQQQIPERIWVEDYFKKYLRPNKLFNDTLYIGMLEGGQKKTQRKQFETYQELYMGTRHRGNNVLNSNDVIYLRAAIDKLEGEIKLKFYNDCYLIWNIGGGTETNDLSKLVMEKVLRGEEITKRIQDLKVDASSDATVYFFLPRVYSKIAGLDSMNVKALRLGEVNKLKELDLGGSGKIFDQFEDDFTIGKDGSNLLLRKLIAKNLVAVGKGEGTNLDLRGLKSLKELDTEGSNFTNIMLPNGAPLKSVKLNKYTGLSANNLYQLETLTRQGEGKIDIVVLNNIDNSPGVNSLDLVKDALDKNLDGFCLQKVQWDLGLQDVDTTNNKIYIIEELMPKRHMASLAVDYDTEKKYQSLTGYINISGNVNINNAETALNIYNNYRNLYPQLNINFSNESCKLYSVTINGLQNGSWKYVSSIKLSEFFINKISDEEYENIIEKNSVNDYVVNTFKGWEIYVDGKKVTTVDNFRQYSSSLTGEIVIIPIFQQEPKRYDMYYNTGYGGGGRISTTPFEAFDMDKNKINTLGDYKNTIENWKYSVVFDHSIAIRRFEDEATRIVCYGVIPHPSNCSGIGESFPEEARTFETKEILENQLKIYLNNNYGVNSVNEMKITQTFYFIPWYYKESATSKVLSQDLLNRYFSFEQNEDGISISQNSTYSISHYTHNISLPKQYNGIDITEIKDFSSVGGIEYVNWPDGYGVKRIAANAFKNVSTELKDYGSIIKTGLQKIGDSAFENSQYPNPNNTIQDIIIPNTVESIGNKAFYNIKTKKGNLIINSNNVSIGDDAFVQLENAYYFKCTEATCPFEQIDGKVTCTHDVSSGG